MEVKLCSLYFKLILYNLLNNYFKVLCNIESMILNRFISMTSFPSAGNQTQCFPHISQTGTSLQSYSHSPKSLCFKTFSGLRWYSKPKNHGKDNSGAFLTLIDTQSRIRKKLPQWLVSCDNLVRLCSMKTSQN